MLEPPDHNVELVIFQILHDLYLLSTRWHNLAWDTGPSRYGKIQSLSYDNGDVAVCIRPTHLNHIATESVPSLVGGNSSNRIQGFRTMKVLGPWHSDMKTQNVCHAGGMDLRNATAWERTPRPNKTRPRRPGGRILCATHPTLFHVFTRARHTGDKLEKWILIFSATVWSNLHSESYVGAGICVLE